MAGAGMAGAGTLFSTFGNIMGGIGQMEGINAARANAQLERTKQQEWADQARTRQQDIQQPWLRGGQQAFSDLQNFRMREADPYQAQQFAGVKMAEDPGVQYRMQQAQQGLDASAANRGALFSGAQQKAMAEHMQNLASQEFSNAYQRQYGQYSDAENARRDQANREAMRMMNYDQARMGQLQGIAGQGQTAVGQMAGQFGSIDQGNMGRQMQIGGALTDLEGASAAAPWMIGKTALGSLGQGMSSFGGGYGGGAMQSLFGTGG